MNFNDIISRATPPPERGDSNAFEPIDTPEHSLALRRKRIYAAFGSRERAESHAESLGITPEDWFDRFRNVRVAGPLPDWAKCFRELAARQPKDSDDEPFSSILNWVREEVRTVWPERLPSSPEAMDGPATALANRMYGALEPIFKFEQKLGSRPSWESRFRNNPALAFVLGRITADWLDDNLRMIQAAASDRNFISEKFFGGNDPGKLFKIEPGLGDPHAGGRSVAILHFERGKIVFKPKDLRVAEAVANIALNFSDTGLIGPEIETRDGYAWEAFQSVGPVADREGADAFYKALGGWLALLQTLAGNDFWFDNLFADGQTPRFVDFETALQPRSEQWLRNYIPFLDDNSLGYECNPFNSGIMPMLFPGAEGRDVIDIGCLSRPGRHEMPLPNFDSNEPRSWYEDRFAPKFENGDWADVADHFEAFETGYFEVADSLRATSSWDRIDKELLRVDDAPVRIILIDTWTCYRMVRQSLIPRLLSDSVWREIEMHKHLTGWDTMKGPIREAAVRDLRRTDIPLFQTPLNSRDIFGVEGERIKGFFDQNGIENARLRLSKLSAIPNAQKRADLRSGFSLRPNNPPRRQPNDEHLPPAGKDELLNWANEIMSRIIGSAMADSNGGPSWICLNHNVFTGVRTIGPAGFDILTGRAGIAKAMLEVSSALQRDEHSVFAKECLAGAIATYINGGESTLYSGAGLAVGVGGLVAAAAAIDDLRSMAEELFAYASEHEIWMRSGEDSASGLAGWRVATRALDKPDTKNCGSGKPYAPSSIPRLAPWLNPESVVNPCPDRMAAARLRKDFENHGTWFVETWLSDCHNLSGIDGLAALAVKFVRLANSPD